MSYEQGGITCEAIDEPRKSSKAIDKRVIINFRDKNVVIARFCDKNEVFVLFIIYIIYKYIYNNKYNKNLIFVAKTCNYDIFVAKTRNYDIFVAKIYDYALIDSF